MKRIKTAALLFSIVALLSCTHKESADTLWIESGYKVNIHTVYPKTNMDSPGYRYAEKYLLEKYRLSIEWEYVLFDNWDEHVNLLMATKDMPELLEWDFRTWKFPRLKGWVEEGMLHPLPDLSKYRNLEKIADVMPEYKYTEVNGNNYMWPLLRGDMPVDNRTSPIDIIYREDWARVLGMHKEVYTPEDFFNLAKAFIEKDLGNTGSGKTIGYAESGWGFGEIIRMFNNPPADFIKRGEKYVWTGYDKATAEGVAFLHRMYQEGLYYPEFFNGRSDSSSELLISGRLGILFDNFPISSIAGIYDAFSLKFPHKDPELCLNYMPVVASDGNPWAYEQLPSWSSVLFSAGIPDNEFNSIMEIWNALAGTDGQKKETSYSGDGIEPDFGLLNRMVKLGMERDFDSPDLPENLKQRFMDRRFIKMKTPNREKLDLDLNFSPVMINNPDFYNLASRHASPFFNEIKRIIISSSDPETDYMNYVESLRPDIEHILHQLN